MKARARNGEREKRNYFSMEPICPSLDRVHALTVVFHMIYIYGNALLTVKTTTTTMMMNVYLLMMHILSRREET
jgi:hypothetical protein